MSTGGKGSGRRPLKTNRKQFEQNWDTIFPPKKKEPADGNQPARSN